MSFADSIVLKDAANADVTYIKLSNDSVSCAFADSASTLEHPRTMGISHQMTKTRDGSDRHLVKFTSVASDTEDKAYTLVINCSMAVPRKGITIVHVKDAIASLKTFLTEENVAKILRGEL